MNAELIWNKKMEFQCINGENKTLIDAMNEHGGNHAGPTPKELVLNAMMGCTAMDVVAMLKKMRQEVTAFTMSVEAEKTQEHPVHFKKAKLIYRLQGAIENEKAIKSVEASLTKYCGVNYMISKTCHITYELFINGSLIKEGQTNFLA